MWVLYVALWLLRLDSDRRAEGCYSQSAQLPLHTHQQPEGVHLQTQAHNLLLFVRWGFRLRLFNTVALISW